MTVLVLGMTMGIQWTFLLIVVEDVANVWDPTFPYIKLLQGLLVGSDCFLGDVPFLYISCKYLSKLASSFYIICAEECCTWQKKKMCSFINTSSYILNIVCIIYIS